MSIKSFGGSRSVGVGGRGAHEQLADPLPSQTQHPSHPQCLCLPLTVSFSWAALFLRPSFSSPLPLWLHLVLFGNLRTHRSWPFAASACVFVPSHLHRRNRSWVGKSVCSFCQITQKQKYAPLNAGWRRHLKRNVAIASSVQQCQSDLRQVQSSPLTSYPGQLLALLLILNSVLAVTQLALQTLNFSSADFSYEVFIQFWWELVSLLTFFWHICFSKCHPPSCVKMCQLCLYF